MAEPASERSTQSVSGCLSMFGNGAFASCIAEATTLPLEVTKMRLQLQKNNKDPLRSPRYTGMVDAFQSIVRQERWFSLFKGLEAGMHKQILYTGLRLGLYDHLTSSTVEGGVSIPEKIAYAGLTTGIGIAVANPADLVQTKYIAWRQTPMAEPLHSAAPPVAASSQARPTMFANRAAGSEPAPSGGSSKPSAPGLDTNRSSYHTRPFSPHNRARACKSLLMMRIEQRVRTSLAPQPMQRMHIVPPWQAHSCSGSRTQVCVNSLQAGVFRRLLAGHPGHNTHLDTNSRFPGPRTVTGVPLQNARRAYYIIVKEEGLMGLYRGFWANFACSCVQGATEIACYDVTKNILLEAGANDGVPVHLTAGMCAGLLSTLLSNPFDVVATRMMAAKKASAAQRSTLEEVLKIARREGILAFYQGFGPNVLRVGSYNVILWLTYEQLRKVTSMYSLQ